MLFFVSFFADVFLLTTVLMGWCVFIRVGTISHVSLANSQDNSAKSDVEEREGDGRRICQPARHELQGCMRGPVLLANGSIDEGGSGGSHAIKNSFGICEEP